MMDIICTLVKLNSKIQLQKLQITKIVNFQGQLYAADIVLDCTGLYPETSLTRQTFGK